MKKILRLLFVALFAVAITSCDKDSDQPNNPNGGTNKPGVSVPDPTGTVTLKMRNKDNGKTYLDDRNIYIDEGNNFCGAIFVDVGKVAGLGNITSIPKVGWASNVAVNPGHGYVAYSYGIFYRIYVTEWTLTAGNLIIGAEVKYQKPFSGENEDLILDTQSLTFDMDGGVQRVIIKNKSIIPFSISSSNGWCEVLTASTTDYDFLTNAISIYVHPNNSISSDEAIITLTTTSGKVSRIKVSRLGATPVLEFENANATLPAEAGMYEIPIMTNIGLGDIALTSSAEWLSIGLTDDIQRIRQNSSNIKFVNGKPISRGYEEEWGAHYYNIKARFDTNYGGSQRKAVISASYQKLTTTAEVTQMGSEFQLVVTEGTASSSMGSKVIYATSQVPDESLNVSSDKEWCRVSFVRENSRASHSHRIEVTYDDNKNADERIAHINVMNPNKETLATYTLTQLGASINIATEEQPINISCHGITGSSFKIDSPFAKEELIVSSSAKWLKAKIDDNNQLIVDAEYNPTLEDRKSRLTLTAKESDVSTKIEFNQEKGYLKLVISDKLTLDLTPSATLYRQKNKITETYTIETSFSNLQPKSSADWCVISEANNKLVVRISETPNINRECTISFEGSPTSLTIKQIKYAIGDEYIGESEPYSGRLIYLNETTGSAVMSKIIGDQYIWSKELVETGATDYYDGIKNTLAIKSMPNWREMYPAFAAVDDLNGDTNAGWHIPAFLEGTNENWCSSVYTNNYHWSSTSISSTSALCCYYGTYCTNAAWGCQKNKLSYNYSKVYTMGVRRFQIE